MEAARDFTPIDDDDDDEDDDEDPARHSGLDAGLDAGLGAGVDAALAALQAVSPTAIEDAGSWGFRAASDFAGRMEEIARTVEYLQLVAASAVDRSRKQSAAAAHTAAS